MEDSSSNRTDERLHRARQKNSDSPIWMHPARTRAGSITATRWRGSTEASGRERRLSGGATILWREWREACTSRRHRATRTRRERRGAVRATWPAWTRWEWRTHHVGWRNARCARRTYINMPSSGGKIHRQQLSEERLKHEPLTHVSWAIHHHAWWPTKTRRRSYEERSNR
ncbi:hypothetical protein DL93DRAFT_450758 [Clavulina sp. PMI_390]|nr:hypothetical protein DL93DRAFT_450758 [Clavulina sp. PMI_390]